MNPRAEPYSLLPGASWLTEEGEIHIVPGFHEEWIKAHPELVGEAKNVCEVVLAKKWISIALFGGGYVELFVHDRRDPELRRRLGRLLGGAAGSWSKALVMAMDEEGYAMLTPADVASPETLAAALERKL